MSKAAFESSVWLQDPLSRQTPVLVVLYEKLWQPSSASHTFEHASADGTFLAVRIIGLCTTLPAIGPWYPSLKHTNVVVVCVDVVVVVVVMVAVDVVVVSSTQKTLPIVSSTKLSRRRPLKSSTRKALSQLSKSAHPTIALISSFGPVFPSSGENWFPMPITKKEVYADASVAVVNVWPRSSLAPSAMSSVTVFDGSPLYPAAAPFVYWPISLDNALYVFVAPGRPGFALNVEIADATAASLTPVLNLVSVLGLSA